MTEAHCEICKMLGRMVTASHRATGYVASAPNEAVAEGGWATLCSTHYMEYATRVKRVRKIRDSGAYGREARGQ